MMRWSKFKRNSRKGALALGPLACLAVLAGCAIHPLPEDVAPLNTVEIVDHIRCEMYQAVRKQIVLIFRLSGTSEALRVADDIERHPEKSLKEFQVKQHLLKPVYVNRIKAFGTTEIGYGFRFNITEQNAASTDLLFTLPWNAADIFTLRAGGGIDKRRANTRRFFKVENFEELALSFDCLARELNPPNFIYPITGVIGLENVVDDFAKLSTRGARFWRRQGRQELFRAADVHDRDFRLGQSAYPARSD